MRFHIEKLGRWSDDHPFKVERERIQAYAAATNDDNPQHSSGEIAPPVFAIIPQWDAMRQAAGMVVPLEALVRAVHGEQDMFFHKPIHPGMLLISRGTTIGVHDKASGTTVIVKTETRDEHGELVVEQYAITFCRGVHADESAGGQAPDHAVPEELPQSPPLASVTYTIDEDQPVRYAQASGDHNPIHLDADFARSVGLPGVIVHGMCTMAFAGRAIVASVCSGDSTRVKRLAVRFSSLLLPTEQITTYLWNAGQRAGHTIYAYETRKTAGQAVLKHGLAEIASELA